MGSTAFCLIPVDHNLHFIVPVAPPRNLGNGTETLTKQRPRQKLREMQVKASEAS